MDFDTLLVNHIGGFGRCQLLVFFLLSMTEIQITFNNLNIVFLAGVPDHWCSVPELDHLNLSSEAVKNLTIPFEEKDGEMIYSSCRRYKQNFTSWTEEKVEEALAIGLQETWNWTDTCSNGWEYDTSVYTSTIVSQWDLVCDNSWYQATTSAVYMAGLMVGVLSMSAVSDLLGRRPAVLVSLVLGQMANLAVVFSPNIIVFCILRFFVAMFTMSIFTSALVLTLELVGPSWRVHVVMSVLYFWCMTYMTMAGIAYGVRDWFSLQLIYAICCVVVTIPTCLVPESPRWLYTQKKVERADTIVRKMARINKTSIPKEFEVSVMENQRKGFIWDLVNTPRIRMRSVNLFYNWFVNSLVYYGLSLNTSNLGGNVYLNFFISGAVEVPAYACAQVIVVYFGRRWPLAGSLWLGGVALLCTMAVPNHLSWVTILLSTIGKFGITASFAIVYIFTAELYPTVIRNTAVGTCSFFARLGGVLVPYIVLLSTVSKFIPLFTFGSLALLAGMLTLLLPETKDEKLPETIEEVENFGRKKSLENGVKPVYL